MDTEELDVQESLATAKTELRLQEAAEIVERLAAVRFSPPPGRRSRAQILPEPSSGAPYFTPVQDPPPKEARKKDTARLLKEESRKRRNEEEDEEKEAKIVTAHRLFKHAALAKLKPDHPSEYEHQPKYYPHPLNGSVNFI